jgi:hypothetical protein
MFFGEFSHFAQKEKLKGTFFFSDVSYRGNNLMEFNRKISLASHKLMLLVSFGLILHQNIHAMKLDKFIHHA